MPFVETLQTVVHCNALLAWDQREAYDGVPDGSFIAYWVNVIDTLNEYHIAFDRTQTLTLYCSEWLREAAKGPTNGHPE
jgi:hypothetical protein